MAWSTVYVENDPDEEDGWYCYGGLGHINGPFKTEDDADEFLDMIGDY